jgi:hypothetical protein
VEPQKIMEIFHALVSAKRWRTGAVARLFGRFPRRGLLAAKKKAMSLCKS